MVRAKDESLFRFIGISVFQERIYRTRSAEGETFLVDSDLAAAGPPRRGLLQELGSANNLRLVERYPRERTGWMQPGS